MMLLPERGLQRFQGWHSGPGPWPSRSLSAMWRAQSLRLSWMRGQLQVNRAHISKKGSSLLRFLLVEAMRVMFR